jgi:mono/diheme cytochrome c family protein
MHYRFLLAFVITLWEHSPASESEEEKRIILMKNRFLVGLIAGVILTVLLIVGGTSIYFAGGYAPVATAAGPMPFEKTLASIALHARVEKEMPKNVPIEPTEANLMTGAMIYQQHCAVCHGLPGEPKTAIAQGMFPGPPQLFHGKGVTDDPPGETYWKVANGIRLTGMPGFRSTLKDEQLWRVSLLLAKANELPASVKSVLTEKDSPAGK